MASLTNKKIKDTYEGLIKTTDNAAISGEVELTDGAGNSTGINISNEGSLTATGEVTADSFVGDGSGLTNVSGAVSSVNTQTGAVVLDTDDVSEGTTNLYYTDARVESNSAVAANTAKVGITTAQADAIVANTAKNSYPTADATKLAGIEAGAEVNPASTDELSEGSTNLYYTDARVSANSDVVANTAKNSYPTADATKLAGIEAGAEVNDVTSVNTQTGAVVLDADDIDDTATTNKFTTAGDISKLSGIEAGADVTDATNVAAAGALMSGTAVISDLNDVASTTPTDGQVLTYDTTNGWQPETPTGAVDSVNGQTGTVVLDADDIDDTATTNKFTTAADISKLAGIEAGAEVNDVNSVNGQTGAVSLDTADLTDIDTTAPTDGQVLRYVSASSKYVPTTLSSTAPVDSVNGQTGAVVLDADDISDAATTNKYTTASDITKLAGIESGADVTDSANVTTALGSISVTAHSDVTSAGSGSIITSAERTKLSGIETGADVTDTANVTTALNSISIKELSDVSATSPTNNQVLQFNSTSGEYEPATISTTAPVDSVNGQTGTVVLDADDISDSTTTNKWATAAEKTKLGHISVTQAVDLDTMESDIATNNAKNSYPSADATKVGFISVTQAVDLDTMESDIATNNAKVSNVTTNLTTSTTTTSVTVNSSDGTDATINAASGTAAGVMTTADKNKLDGIASGAEVNVNADWNATSGDAQILNKPTIPTATSDLTNDSGFITASSTDTLTNKSGSNSQWTNDAGYLTGNQTITLSGDISGSGTTAITASIASNAVGADELNVSGNGTSGQVLSSDGDGSFSWVNDGGTYTPSAISTATTAVKDYLYILTASLTLTLPASPSAGDSIKIANLSGVATCVIGRNGSNIMATAEDMTLDDNTANFELIYTNATQGWVIIGAN
jgi:trimeric autotransporter adhesin